jgi:hypothetical protein
MMDGLRRDEKRGYKVDLDVVLLFDLTAITAEYLIHEQQNYRLEGPIICKVRDEMRTKRFFKNQEDVVREAYIISVYHFNLNKIKGPKIVCAAATKICRFAD